MFYNSGDNVGSLGAMLALYVAIKSNSELNKVNIELLELQRDSNTLSSKSATVEEQRDIPAVTILDPYTQPLKGNKDI